MFENAMLLLLSFGLYSSVLCIGYPLFNRYYKRYRREQQCKLRRVYAKQYLRDFVENEYKD